MDEQSIVVGLIVVSILALGIYGVKRNFDENAFYIQNGYHRVAGTNTEVWVK